MFKIGQKVCFNPEVVDINSLYPKIKEYSAGYVVFEDDNYLKVAFNSNSELTVKLEKSAFLPIDTPLADITIYTIKNSARIIYLINNEESNLLNSLIIKYGCEIASITHYSQGEKTIIQ